MSPWRSKHLYIVIAMEARWTKSISVTFPREHVVILNVNLAGLGLTDQDANEWARWTKSYLQHRRCTRSVGVLDISRNKLTDVGLTYVLEAVTENLGGGVQKLRCHCNYLRTLPVPTLLSCGESLSELHLSHNHLTAQSILDLIICFIDSDRYPLDGKQPLWLRIEKNPGCLSSKLSGCSPLHCSRICEVDGKNGCSPYVCRRQRVSKPALHLTYMSVCVETRNESYSKPTSRVPKKAVRDNQAICCENVSAWSPEAMAERRRRKEISQLADPLSMTQISEAITQAE